MSTEKKTVAVLGAGSWGVTLARVFAENGHSVRLWCYLPEEYEILSAHRERRDILPGIVVPDSVAFSTDAAEVVAGADAVFFVVPSFGVRATAAKIAAACDGSQIAVSAAKGLEEGTFLRMTEVMADELGDRARGFVSFSGPSHAEEVSRRIPTTIVAAAADDGVAREVRDLAFAPYLRVYTNTDVLGVEYGAALKNVIAIAAGVVDGLGYGDNTKAALLTRGLAEISRLGVARGADPLTFAGLSGLGDLVVTCMSRHSRNRYVGEELGRGRPLDDILDSMQMVAEGVRTTKVARALSVEAAVEMPITEAMYQVMFEGRAPRAAVTELMGRTPKSEL
ncbi:MAG: NAD(P)H-dependent glycerol-3-phosphate dehydrogenase [Candidatus Zixiibacteriota bacterium]